MNITYTVEKKRKCYYENMEIWHYQKFHHFISLPFFGNFAPPLTQSQLRH